MRAILFVVIFGCLLPLVLKEPFFGALMWFAFSLGNPHQMIYGPLASLPFALIIAVVTLASWLVSREPKKFPLLPFIALTLLFSAWTTLTTQLAPDPARAYEKWQMVQKMLLFTVVAYALTTTRRRLDALVWVIVASIGFYGVKGGLWSIASGGSNRVFGPPGSMIGDNNNLGLALVMILPLLFYLSQTAHRQAIKLGLLGLGFLTVIAIFFTYSRGAFIATAAMASVLWFRSQAKFVTAIAIFIAGIFVFNFAPPQWFARMSSIETRADASSNERLYLYKVSLAITEARLITGGGFDITFFPDLANPILASSNLPQLTRARATHSIYMDVATEHGLVGLAIFVLIAVCSWRNASWLIRRSRGRDDLLWAGTLGRMAHAMLVGFWVGGAFTSMAYYDGYWAVLACLAAARRIIATESAPGRVRIGGGALPARMAVAASFGGRSLGRGEHVARRF